MIQIISYLSLPLCFILGLRIKNFRIVDVGKELLSQKIGFEYNVKRLKDEKLLKGVNDFFAHLLWDFVMKLSGMRIDHSHVRPGAPWQVISQTEKLVAGKMDCCNTEQLC